jgi:amino acid adenylation domain-containing protein/thioester reductase-like protein
MNERQLLPLTYGQLGLWFLHHADPATDSYHIAAAARSPLLLDLDVFARAFAQLARRHPILRARFVVRDGVPWMDLADGPTELIAIDDIPDDDQAWRAKLIALVRQPFALELKPGLRCVVQHGARGTRIGVIVHHVIADFWSMSVLLRDLETAYLAMVSSREPSWRRPAADCFRWREREEALIRSPQGRELMEWWSATLAGAPRKLRLPGLPPAHVDSASGRTHRISIDAPTACALRATAKRGNVTPCATFFAAWAATLMRVSGDHDLVIGVPASLRKHHDERDVIGYCVNTVPVRVRTGSDATVAEVAETSRCAFASALARRAMPFTKIIERLGSSGSATSPVFQALFAYQKAPRGGDGLAAFSLGVDGEPPRFAGAPLELLDLGERQPQYPVTLTLVEAADGFVATLVSDRRLVGNLAADALATCFIDSVRTLVSAPETRIAQLRCEQHPSAPRTVSPNRVLPDILATAARQTPSAAAACVHDEGISYADLDIDAGRMASAIVCAGGVAGDGVAILVENPYETALAIVGAMRIGMAAVPLDLSWPDPLLAEAITSLRLRVAVTSAKTAERLRALGCVTIQPTDRAALRPLPQVDIPPDAIAYVIHTSGSSGRPKAVAVSHAAALNHAIAAASIFTLEAGDRVLQYHAFAFDAALEEIFPTWQAGATVVFASDIRTWSATRLFEFVQRENVTVLNLPTARWHLLVDEMVEHGIKLPSSLRLVVVGGERASAQRYGVWRSMVGDRVRWLNTYGVTEAAISSLWYDPVADDWNGDEMPIGWPFNGVGVHVLDENLRPVPSGAIGELCIGGAGLAAGYAGDIERTLERFIEAPGYGRIYRTGDLGASDGRGCHIFHGRRDREVKVRGIRVDPSALEAALMAETGVREAAVAVRMQADGAALEAFVAVRSGIEVERLLTALRSRLPPALVPGRLVIMPSLPRTAGGKVDRALLSAAPARQMVENSDPALATVIAEFNRILGRQLGPDDEFFAHGGHSLLALRLISRLRLQFGVELALSELLSALTPRSVTRRIQESLGTASDATGAQQIHEESAPLSPTQERMWFADRFLPPAFTSATALYRARGPLDLAALRFAFIELTRRHDALRARVVMDDNGARSMCDSHDRQGDDGFTIVPDRALLRAFEPFDLTSPGSRVRCRVSRIAPSVHDIALTAHSFAVDAWSSMVLLEELAELYVAYRHGTTAALSSAPSWFAYSRRQQDFLAEPEAQQHLAWWREHLSGAALSLELPKLPTAGGDDTAAAVTRIRLPSRYSRLLATRAQEHGCTLFELTMAVLATVLARYAGSDDVVFGTVLSRRELQPSLVGPLQNPVLLRLSIRAAESFAHFLRRVKAELAAAQAHGDIPFESVLRTVWNAGSESVMRSCVQILSHDLPPGEHRIGDVRLRPLSLPIEHTAFDLTIAIRTSDSLTIDLIRRKSAISAETTRWLRRHVRRVLGIVARNCERVIATIDPRVPFERRRDRRTNATAASRCGLPLHGRLVEFAAKNPSSIAVIAGDQHISYGQLDATANGVARALAAAGACKGDLVAVGLQRGWRGIVAALGVLKSGAIHVPIDPAWPGPRIAAILSAGKIAVAIVDATVPQWAISLRHITADAVTAHPVSPSVPISAEDPAYVMFTSGSSGAPKGVLVAHGAAVATIEDINKRFAVRSDDRVLSVSSPWFDLSIYDIFGILGVGGAVVLPMGEDPRSWRDLVREHRVTLWNSVPCLLQALFATGSGCADLASLRTILLSGDRITLSLARQVRRYFPQARFASLGGATEAAIWSISHEIREIDPDWRGVPYGKPLANQRIDILAPGFVPCATGMIGEIHVSGSGLAIGYLGDDVLTQSKFVRNSHGERLYRTGDLGRRLADGSVEILGRMDRQVKIRGVRVELGDVESALRSCRGVADAVVEVVEGPDRQRALAAWVRAEASAEISAETLRNLLTKALPPGLIPSAINVLESFPLTANGKLDRTALARTTPDSGQLPRNADERAIARVWRELLGREVGIDEDFFAIGGHSLLAVRMADLVGKSLGIELSLPTALRARTIAALAEQANLVRSGIQPRRIQSGARAMRELFETEFGVAASALDNRLFSRRLPSRVLITGATGFIGAHLTARLIRLGLSVCCLVRASDDAQAMARMRATFAREGLDADLADSIDAISGDLRRPHLGLEVKRYGRLAQDIDAVVHAAASVDLVADYRDLRADNTTSVQALIDFAGVGTSKELHHISSVAVFAYRRGRIVDEDESTLNECLIGGYSQSKWMAEALVANATKRGLSATVYRPAQVLGRVQAQGGRRDIIDHAIEACDRLGTYPDLPVTVDAVPVEYVAEAIAWLVARAPRLGGAYHLTHPAALPLSTVLKRLFVARTLQPISLGKWRERLLESAASEPASATLATLLADRDEADLSAPDFRCERLTSALSGSGIECPDLIEALTSHWHAVRALA